MKKTFITLATLAFIPCLFGAQTPRNPAPVASAVESTEHHTARVQWFNEARFGMFIHWGIYSVPAGEWQGKEVRGIGEWIFNHGKIPVADYKAFAKDFTAAKYDPKAWAALAKEAGVKYVVLTAKHHEGFALYDSAASDWNAVKASGAKRDLIAPLAEAVRAEGLKFGLYYSQSQDWGNRGGSVMTRDKGPEKGKWDPAQKGDFDEYLKTISLPQVKEILTRYQPSVIWWDTACDMTTERAKPFAEALAKLSPDIISNNRLGGGYMGDTKTPEQNIPPRGFPGEMFEVCMTMNDTWGYKKMDNKWKSVHEILRNLSDISSKGGNFLLNVGPTAEGEIPQASIDRLKEVGRWMAINGEAIYATQAGPFQKRLSWGRVTQKANAKGGAALYLHVWEWPKDGKLLLPTVQQKPVAARILKGGASVASELSAEGLTVNLPGEATDPDVSMVVLEFSKPVTVTQEAGTLPGKDGVITLLPGDADPHGSATGNIEMVGSGAETYLSKWSSLNWSVEYCVKTPASGKWNVTAEIAAQKPVKLILDHATGRKRSDADLTKLTPVEVAATGGDETWKVRDLGSIELPKGETTLAILAAKEAWSTINLRRVWLTPSR